MNHDFVKLAIFTSIHYTSEALFAAFKGDPHNYNVFTIQQLSTHIPPDVIRGSTLIWIDLPRRHLHITNVNKVFAQLHHLADANKVPIIVTNMNTRNRFSRNSELRKALSGYHRSTHCPCRYRESRHGSVDFYTRSFDDYHNHTDFGCIRSQCCKKGPDFEPVETEQVGELWRYFISKWVQTWFHDLPPPCYHAQLDVGTFGADIGSTCLSGSDSSLSVRDLGSHLLTAQTPSGSQQTPDSLHLGGAHKDTNLTDRHRALLSTPELSTSSSSGQQVLYQCYLQDTNIICALHTDTATMPKHVISGTYDLTTHLPVSIMPGGNKLVRFRTSVTLPPGTTGQIGPSARSTLSDNVYVTPGLLDGSSTRELCVLLTNTANAGTTIPPGTVVASVTFTPSAYHSISSQALAFPTEARVREQEAQRAAKAAGKEIVKVKRKKFVQDHHDDCGENMSSISDETFWSNPMSSEDWVVPLLESDSDVPPCGPDSDSESDLGDTIGDGLNYTMFYGSVADKHIYITNLKVFVAKDVAQLLQVAGQFSQGEKGTEVDVAEICGGSARTSQLAVRRNLRTGRNFDLVTHVDLAKEKDAADAYSYFVQCMVLVAVMAPCCDCFGPLSHLNWSINYDTMLEKYQNSAAVARFCGRVALLQLNKSLDFLCEQPHPSDLYCEGVWPEVFTWPTVEQVTYDRCRCGLKVSTGEHKGLYIRKPSTMTVSCRELGDPFRGLTCDHTHEHLQGIGHNKEHSDAQEWTDQEADRVVQGCVNVRKRHLSGKSTSTYHLYYPIDRATIARATPGGVPTRSRDPNAPEPKGSPCLGCRHYRARNDPEHNRKVGECGYPYDNPEIWACDACLEHKPRLDQKHTYTPSECKWATAQVRSHAPRTGRHPRDPATPASDDPTANAPGTVGGTELGADAEQELEQREDRVLKQLTKMKEVEQQMEGASSSSSSAPRNPRGPDTQQRHRTTIAETGSGPANTTDWTNFDVARALRALRLGDDTQQRLVIRKLHLRWWHASAAAMERLLERAGCPKAALDKIKPICDTCAACRAWAKPRPDSIATIEVVDKFNQKVEYDIVFIYKYAIFHLVDKCLRWQETYIVDSKSEEDLIDALDVWISRHGPMAELVGDGESGIVRSALTQEYLRRKGIKSTPRAKEQHARVAERRGALLRDCVHRMDAQLGLEGINHIPFKHRLSEATFCLNALLTVNGSSPYNGLYGRVPNILPDINCPDAEHEEDVPKPGLLRHTNRLREISVQTIVDGTARARLGRALKTRTLPTGERENYQVGEEVDIYRSPGTKDVSGWHGPATIVDLTNIPRGIISVRSNNVVKDARVGDVRRHLQFLCLLAAHGIQFAGGPGWSNCRQFVEYLTVGTILTLGWILSNNTWHLTRDSKSHWSSFEMLYNFATNHLRLDNIYTIRAGHGVGSVPKLTGYSEGIVLRWHAGTAEPSIIEQTATNDVLGHLSWQSMFPDTWRQCRWIQFARVVEEAHITLDPDHNQHSTPQPSEPNTPQTDSRLSTIPEEDSADIQSQETFLAGHEGDADPEFLGQLQGALREANMYLGLEADADYGQPSCGDRVSSSSQDLSWHSDLARDNFSYSPFVPPLEMHTDTVFNYHLIAANARAGLPADYNLEPEATYIEIGYTDYMWRTIPDVPREPLEGEIVTVKMYHTQHKGKAQRIVNVERDDDLLTPAELKEHADEVNAAMKKELSTWATHGCFSRRSRNGARNVIDCRWVIKWKWDEETLTVAAAASGQVAKRRRVIRARLTVRGFKDVDKGQVATYAGTSQRFSQRVIVSEAVIRGWDLVTTDISKAFLQGVTYEELAALTGEPVREVNFYLPAYNIPQLRQVSGFENFDPNAEVLHCDKPGTGSVDAPRCFSIKLAKVTEQCGLVPSNVDPELCFMHQERNNKWVLVAIITKHVDDIKATGEHEVVMRILKVIEGVFGAMKLSYNNFTNCGVRHIQCATTKEASLDQTEYIAGLKTIPPESYRNLSSNSKCDPTLHLQYQSLLGAVAFTALTRVDAIVFIVALQRYSHAPEVIHVKRLNVLVKWMQHSPHKLTFKRFSSSSSPQHVKIIGDSSFKKEEEKGHSLRGVLILRCESQGTIDFTKGGTVHVLDFATKALRLVTRSTFSAELLGGCDSFDLGLLIMFILNEIVSGVPSKADARTLREHGGFAVPAVLCIDALSVYAAVTATYIKPPAEKGLLAHVQYLRELLDHHVLEALMWLDTRDMTADGLTKGAVERDALHLLMAGSLEIKQTPKVWSSLCKR